MSQTIATPPTVRLDSDVIGRPISRPEGPAKVSGAAKYAAEFSVNGPLWYAYAVSSPIAKGKITKIHADEVLALPGVQHVFSHENVPSLAWFDRSYKDDVAPGGSPFRPLHSPEIMFSQQPVALVVADTFELARYAASVLRIEYDVAEYNTDLEKARADGQGFDAPKGKTGFLPPPKPKGDADKAYAAAPHKISGEYTHNAQVHNPMEMFATTVEWLGDGQKMNIYDKTQGAPNVQQYLMKIFGLSKEEARVISKYTGGGFGSGLRPQHQVFMAVLAALELKHSVRLTLTRSQMFSLGHRPQTIQDIKLATDEQGYLQAIEHNAFGETSQFENETETVVNWSGILYTSPNSKFQHQLARVDLDTPADMRAPGAATGNFAIESAIDEMAFAAGVDPLTFRLLNYTYTDPTENKPFSSKRLDDCYHEGAARFGWNQRNPAPRSMRDESGLLVGWGMAGGCWDASMQKAGAKASLSADGHLTVSSATNDQGAGTYVIMTQVAAQTLGLPMAQVTFSLGDTNFPAAPVQGGSWTAASVGSAVQATCQKLGEKLLKLAQDMDNSPLKGVKFEDVQFADGHIRANEDISRTVAIRDVLAASGEAKVEAEGSAMPNPINMLKYSLHSHNAAFVEVKVDEDLGTIHVTRVVNAVAAGRILNPKTARSQVLGGTVWGIGMALMEETYLNNGLGRYMNHNYAEYHIPVNADIHKIDVIFVEEEDDIVSPLGVKGVGEIGMLGVAAAIANAVFHATGKRVRDLPVTSDKLL